MTQNTIINGLPYSELTDLLGSYGTRKKSEWSALDTRVNARFGSAAARNSAYAAFVAQGGVMTDGMMCSVAGNPMIWYAGQWHGIRNTSVNTTAFFDTTISDSGSGGNAEVGVCTLAVPDPGYPYVIEASGMVSVAAQTGANCNARIRLDSLSGAIISAPPFRTGQYPSGEPFPLTLTPYDSGALTGAHSILCTVQRVLGSTNWNVSSGGNYLRAGIRPI